MATKTGSRPLLWIGLSFLVLLGVCFAVLSGDAEPETDEGDAVGAWVVCQQFVEDQLKAPATADYPNVYTDYTHNLGGGKFRVDAFVDSENSFGATIRTNFLCTVDYRGNDNWHLESLTFSE